MQITFATGNKHKLQEINEIVQKYPLLAGADCELRAEAGVGLPASKPSRAEDPLNASNQAGSKSLISGRGQIEFILPPDGFDPIEDGKTFEENSLIKAREAARLSGMMSLADDSGLCVEALGGAPGIHSARYAETAQKRIDKLLDVLKGVENRKAKFVCAMTLVDADGNLLFQTRGECHGEIAREQSGTNGFGYDPIFTVDGFDATMADISEEEKNEISHRGIALRKVLEYILTT